MDRAVDVRRFAHKGLVVSASITRAASFPGHHRGMARESKEEGWGGGGRRWLQRTGREAADGWNVLSSLSSDNWSVI